MLVKFLTACLKVLLTLLCIDAEQNTFWTLFEYVRGYLLNKRLGNETTGFPQIIPMFLNTFITTFGVKQGKHYSIVDNEVVLDDLFR